MALRSVEYSLRIVYCILLGRRREKKAPFHDSVGAEGLTIRSIRTDGKVPLRSVEYSSRIADCILLGRLRKKTYEFDDSVGGRRLNDPFDPYGWLSFLTLRRVQFTDGILHHIRDIVVV